MTSTATTYAYRSKVAQAAARGGALPRISHLAFGTGARPYRLDDEALEAEFIRLPASLQVRGVLLMASATLVGRAVGNRVLREIGAFAEDGTLVGRRVIAAKGFEPETELDIELTFQY